MNKARDDKRDFEEYVSMPVPPINPVLVLGVIRGSIHMPRFLWRKVLFYGENRLWEEKYGKPNPLRDGFNVLEPQAEEMADILHPKGQDQ